MNTLALFRFAFNFNLSVPSFFVTWRDGDEEKAWWQELHEKINMYAYILPYNHVIGYYN